jgi:hypothetical protein
MLFLGRKMWLEAAVLSLVWYLITQAQRARVALGK